MKRSATTLLAAVVLWGQGRVELSESGGRLSLEQASYDVLSYDLALAIEPADRAIEGTLTVEARVVHRLEWLVLDLDSPLKVSSTAWLDGDRESELDFERTERQLRIRLPGVRQPGETLRVRVAYAGKPREAPRPPWAGGFVWSKTADGQPWVAIACQLEGADLWWPNKDHPSDEPERMDLRFTVPRPLLAISNGTLQSVRETGDRRRTFHWRVDNPINAYNVTVNIAPYRAIRGSYRSVTGRSAPTTFWALPENHSKARKLFRQFEPQLRFLEETLGPYPFLNEKYGVAEAPFLGMEHQTLIAYGNQYRNNELGFDSLHFHELAHEWWGNLVSVSDWKDYWIHEGFATYMECLYAEKLGGEAALRRMTASLRPRLRNREPLAPRESKSSIEKYFIGPDYLEADGDVNFKGALTLHTLRWLIGDPAFFEALRRFAYPDPPRPDESGSCRCRSVDTEDFIQTVEKVSGRDLGWFFEAYLRESGLPRLEVRQKRRSLELEWASPRPFPMPIEVSADGRLQRVETPDGRATLPLQDPETVKIDPSGWVLREER